MLDTNIKYPNFSDVVNIVQTNLENDSRVGTTFFALSLEEDYSIDINYPAAYIHPSDITYTGQTLQYELIVEVMDIAQQQDSLKHVFSNTSQILIDLLSKLYRDQDNLSFSFIQEDQILEAVEADYQDRVSGYRLSLILEVKAANRIC